MAEIAAIAALAGSLISAGGQIASGMAEDEAAQTEAVQLEARGREDFAAGQREAIAKRREGTLVNSRIQALAAASGAGSSGDAPSIVKLMSDVSGDAEYNAQTIMYGGDQRRRGMFDSAAARRKSGKAALTGSIFAAAGTALGGASSFATAKGWG